MRNTVKWIGIVIVVLVVLLIIAPFLIPVDKFRPTIEQKATEALGRKVELGKLSLSLISGSLGVDNLTVADDPKFNSGAFLTAKSVKVGVEMMPLIFSKQVNVTSIVIDSPQVMMLKDPSGKWNFSSIGGNATPAQKAPSGGSNPAVSIGKLELKDGQITLGDTNSKKRTVYGNVNLTASDVALANNFPVLFTMGLPGGGTMKIDGKVGPVDANDAAVTPQNVKLTIDNLNLASTGFLDPSLGLGGITDIDATLVSQGGVMNTKGQLKLSKAILIAGGQAASVPAIINFDTSYNLAKGTGVLKPSTLNIGKATTNLSGTYKSEGENFVVDLKVAGEGMPATDLEAFLPALAINVPSGSKLTAGTLSTNLHITGPTNKLVTDGNIGLFNGKLAGFNLGKKMSGVASLAGIKTGDDLNIEKLTTNVHMAPTGLRADNLDLVAPQLGTVVGGGTLDAKNNMDFKLVATVNSSMLGAGGGIVGGTVGQVLGGGSKCKNGGIKVPLQIKGTTANPQFMPDVGGAAASLMKAQLSCAGGDAGGLLKGVTGGAGGGAADTINQLGGLFGKKKKP